MGYVIDQMLQKIEGAGLRAVVIKLNAGEILVSEKAARILACEIDGLEGNLFYSGGEVEAGFYAGGDRLWVAPEAGYYWPSLEKAREDAVKWAKTPAAVDPGQYKIVGEGSMHVMLRNDDVMLMDGRNGRSIKFDVERFVCECPLPSELVGGLKCSSFSITNEMHLKLGDHQAAAGLWDILQVPPRGTLVCPLVKPIESPTSYYEDFGKKHVQWDDQCVRFLIDTARRTKMGLPPEATTGRMGYYREIDGQGVLIVRIFASLVGLPYVDQPIWQDKDCIDGGDVLQAYNDDGSYVPFGEMEYHDPGIVVNCTPGKRSGTSVTHVIAGEPAKVKQAGEALLGCTIEPID